MRITNKMMTNGTLNNINKNKNNLSKLEEQYTSGKVIQKPSDDPIIAVRALKLRSNLTEINQYYKKNIPDARSWMDVSEGAMQKVTELMTSIHTLCVQGANDPLVEEDRKSIADTLLQYKSQIYQEGNADYAGRYVFSGYKTDSSLSYQEADSSLTYTISEQFTKNDIDTTGRITGAYRLEDYTSDNTAADYETTPKTEEAYRFRLAYSDLDNGELTPVLRYKLSEDDEDWTEISAIADYNGEVLNADSPGAYTPGEGEVNFLAASGEMVLSKEVYLELQEAAAIEVTYEKTDFAKGDPRPENYFDCVATKYDEDDEIVGQTEYHKENQEIQYEVSFNQMLTINTQGRDAFAHEIGRQIDEIVEALNNVGKTNQKLIDIEEKLKNATEEDEKAGLEALKRQTEVELDMRNSMMQKSFESSADIFTGYQEQVNISIADLGSRYVRLDLTESRLSTQRTDFEDLLSTNEDADIVDTVVRFNSQEVIYNASLAASAKVVQNTLMDFLR